VSDQDNLPAERAEVVPSVPAPEHVAAEPLETVDQPGKVMRIGTMIRTLLDEVRQTDLDEPSRERLQQIYETSVAELSAAISEDLRDELARLAPPFGDGTPTDAELRIAKAQLVGWLEGLFHGIQATLVAQQMAARQQLDQMRSGLPPGVSGPQQGAPGRGRLTDGERTGTYL